LILFDTVLIFFPLLWDVSFEYGPVGFGTWQQAPGPTGAEVVRAPSNLGVALSFP
jgi:hypothetical protein